MDFSCLHCVGVCRRRGQSDDRHADVFNCLHSQRERGGGGEKKMLMLFNSLPHCHWQQDLRRRSDRCMVMKPALGETRRRLLIAHSQSVPLSFCLAFFLLLSVTHAHSYLSILITIRNKSTRERKNGRKQEQNSHF